MKKLLVIFIAFGLIFTGCSSDHEYSVTYHSNGCTSGFPPNDNNKYKSGDVAVVRDQNTLLRTGFTFISWNTNAEGTGTSYRPGSEITITAATFMYPVWGELP